MVVAGLAIAVNAWLGKQRMSHEEQMQQMRMGHESDLHLQRLAHERRESLRTKAAESYASAFDLLVKMDPDGVEDADSFIPEDIRALEGLRKDTTGRLRTVMAVGWNDEVRDSAAALNAGVQRLATLWFKEYGALVSGDEERYTAELAEAMGEADLAMADYRHAIAGA